MIVKLYSSLILPPDPGFSHNYNYMFTLEVLRKKLIFFFFPLAVRKTTSAFSILSRSIPYLKEPQTSP